MVYRKYSSIHYHFKAASRYYARNIFERFFHLDNSFTVKQISISNLWRSEQEQKSKALICRLYWRWVEQPKVLKFRAESWKLFGPKLDQIKMFYLTFSKSTAGFAYSRFGSIESIQTRIFFFVFKLWFFWQIFLMLKSKE